MMHVIIPIGIVLMLCVHIGSAQLTNLHGCPNIWDSYYPKCGATEKNIGYDTNERKYVPICPSISSGQYPPNCHCRYGGKYVASQNSCPEPQCPTKSVTHGAYPNCECTEPNHEYNAYMNECVRQCPENSTGRYPDCKCNDKLEVFSKEWYTCDRCPPNTRPGSVYPNCECEIGNYVIGLWGDYRNRCHSCKDGFTGKYPDCVCENGNTGVDNCSSCPWTSEGVFPNCICKKSKKPIMKHPFYGDYTCLECPDDSDGVYPDCICNNEFAYYENITNNCRTCPDETKRIEGFPYCTCLDENSSFVPEVGFCRKCPYDSIGKYPNCTCNERDHLFSAYRNFCYPDCLEPSITGLEFNMTNCVNRYAYPGRQCPPNSIGTSPNCKCIEDGKTFYTYGWGCHDIGDIAFGLQYCPNKREKWPQCSVSIDPKVTLSLIG
ncbi:uncharacterized protein LOC119072778 [Bradysia coprophila]|uniref:uncharacterized protein LOC119072778 n=1 Tax=Bradysia coprophila TaxID=38358 RepID=UPI00187D83B2|nr:uncharacterized protein LOC119072778 [Bradysia coprophila]